MDADAHAHAGGHGKDHVPHVLPLSTYLKTWGALLVLTAVTVGASYVNFGAANLWIALLIASVKAATVALVFMHLYWDHKFHSVIFGVALIFLSVFIIFTLFDTQSRGRADGIEGQRPADVRAPFAGTRAEMDYKRAAPGAEGRGGDAAGHRRGGVGGAGPRGLGSGCSEGLGGGYACTEGLEQRGARS